MKGEIWKDVDDFPGYQVSDRGRVKNKNTGLYLKPGLGGAGYLTVALYKNKKATTKNIHELVSDAFLGKKPKGMVVNHNDGNKQNNCLSNLEITTYSGNIRHAYDMGLNPHSKRVKIVETGEIFNSMADCAKAIGGDNSDICYCLSGKLKSHKGLHFEYVDDQPKKKTEPFLRDYQMDAVRQMRTGCILNGGVGSGKSRTSLYYYFSQQGGSKDPDYIPMKNPKDLYIITTAQKRDTLEWNGELVPFLLSTDPEKNKEMYDNKVVIDSWNNIKKYADVQDAFFIFDEDRVTGSGAWVKAFLKIAKVNDWIILSATPGDSYSDYIPVFIANGFFRNKTEFNREHVVYAAYTKYPKIDRYLNTQRLDRLRDRILIDMDFDRKTVAHHEDIYCDFDIPLYKDVMKNKINPYSKGYIPCKANSPGAQLVGFDIDISEIDPILPGWETFKPKNGDYVRLACEPIQQAAGLCYALRRIVNTDESRQVALLELFEKHPRLIIFYNFDHERDILLNLAYGDDVEIAEWSGHKHQPVPECERWIYLVQYTAGNAGWNCIKTDTIVFFSQNYSYKIVTQAAGRIDRLNTPFTDLYYYHLKSRSGIDLAIAKALRDKKKFNERKFTKWKAA